MKAIFADAYYFIALLNPRDQAHELAISASMKRPMSLVTTWWVLTEVLDAMARPPFRQKALELLDQLEANARTSIVSKWRSLARRGIDLYRQRPDKHWSLADCISFVVMQERGSTEALTGDEHFRQAGFIPLLAS